MDTLKMENISLKAWTLNTIYGWLIGFVFVVLLALISDAIGIGDSQFFVGTGMAAGVGFMQNRLLRSKGSWNWNWMWATIIGMTLAFVILEFGSTIIEKAPEFDVQIGVALGGLFVGVLQYLILKTRSVAGSLWWILICFIGWTLSGLIVGLVDFLGDYIPPGPIGLILNLPLMVFVSSLILGLITGTGIIRLLNKKI
jgi:hypothetical protein